MPKPKEPKKGVCECAGMKKYKQQLNEHQLRQKKPSQKKKIKLDPKKVFKFTRSRRKKR